MVATAALNVAAAQVGPALNVGWTWSATMGLVQNLLILTLGGGGLGILVRAGIQLRRIANERAKQDDDRDAARWNELMGLNERLQNRVEKLETDIREERRRCDDDLNAMRRTHIDEMRAVNERLEQLQRTIFQNSASTAAMFASVNPASKAAESIERVGKHLRDAHEGEEK